MDSQPVKDTRVNLDFTEALLYELQEDLQLYIFTQTLIVNSSQQITHDQVKEALLCLTRHYEALQMTVKQDESLGACGHHFVKRENPEDIHVLYTPIQSISDWVHVVNNQENQTLVKQGDLWNVNFCPIENPNTSGEEQNEYQSVLIFAFSHVISDAKSIFDLLMHHFMPVLSSLMNGEEVHLENVPLGKSVEEMFFSERERQSQVPWYMRWGLKLMKWGMKKMKYNTIKLICKDDSESCLEDANEIPVILPILFSKELTSSIIKAAKSNGVSVHSVILIANTLALCQCMEKEGIKIPKCHKTYWPVDMRKYTELHDATAQTLRVVASTAFSSIRTCTTLTDKQFWGMCREIFKEIKRKMKRENLLDHLRLMKCIVKAASKNETVADIMKQTTPEFLACNISNAGIYNTDPELEEKKVRLTLEGQYFYLTGMRQVKSLLFWHGVSTCNGQMMWTLSSDTNRVSRRFSECYGEALVRVFSHYCQEGKDLGTQV